MPTVADVQHRLDAIHADITKTREMLLRLDGAEQDCRYWLAKVTEEEEQMKIRLVEGGVSPQ